MTRQILYIVNIGENSCFILFSEYALRLIDDARIVSPQHCCARLVKTLGCALLRMVNLESLRKLGCHFGGIKRPDSVPLLDLQC